MKAKVLFLLMALTLLVLSACRSPADVTDWVAEGRRAVEASRCAGVDRYAEAIASLERALEADPGCAEAYYWLYVAYTESGDSDGAADALRRLEGVVSEDGGNVAARFWLLKIQVEREAAGEWESLLGQLEAAAASGEASPLYWLGRARYETGDIEGALEALEEATQLDPENAPARFWLGQLYFEQGRLDAAWREFDAVVRLDPDNAAAYHNRGVVAYQMGHLEQAIADLRAAREKDSEDPQTRYQLGAVYLVQAIPVLPGAGLPDEERLQQAEAEFQAALDLCPGMPEALIGLGNLHLLRGDPAAAAERLEQALEQVPDSPQALYALAQAYAQKGDLQAACGTLDRFLELEVSEEWLGQGKEMSDQWGCP